MKRRLDLVGRVFGHLTVVHRGEFSLKGHSTEWLCSCVCGKQILILSGNLTSGRQISCGCKRLGRCHPAKRINLVGSRVGYLTVIEPCGVLSNKTILYKCQCDCGNTVVCRSTRLKSGESAFCGLCLKAGEFDREKVRGFYSYRGLRSEFPISPLLSIWKLMLARCDNHKYFAFFHYGARGIEVSDQWKYFDVFYGWAIRSGWAPGLSIERNDVNGNYCEENCRWATPEEQSSNKRNTMFVQYQGKQVSPAKLWLAYKAKAAVTYQIFSSRIYRGWDVETAAMEPSKTRSRNVSIK